MSEEGRISLDGETSG